MQTRTVLTSLAVYGPTNRRKDPSYSRRSRVYVDEPTSIPGLDAASAAFDVGYESASQFNRQYKRFFGQPPMRDINVRRLASSAIVSD